MWYYFKVNYTASPRNEAIKNESFSIKVFALNADQAKAYAEGANQSLPNAAFVPEDGFPEDIIPMVADPEAATEEYRKVLEELEDVKKRLRALEKIKLDIEKGINHYVHPERYRVIADVLWADDSDEDNFRAKALDLDITKLKWAPDPNQAGMKQ